MSAEHVSGMHPHPSVLQTHDAPSPQNPAGEHAVHGSTQKKVCLSAGSLALLMVEQMGAVEGHAPASAPSPVQYWPTPSELPLSPG
jgi:hypothetical protein